MLRLTASALLLLFSAVAAAQADPAPVEISPAPVPVTAPAPVTSYAAPVNTAPPVLPQQPRRRAIEATATGGSGGMSYSGPSGAMNTSPNGSACAVTCSLQPPEEYQVRCNPGFTALCQCDNAPLAGCFKQ